MIVPPKPDLASAVMDLADGIAWAILLIGCAVILNIAIGMIRRDKGE